MTKSDSNRTNRWRKGGKFSGAHFLVLINVFCSLFRLQQIDDRLRVLEHICYFLHRVEPSQVAYRTSIARLKSCKKEKWTTDYFFDDEIPK